MRVIRAKDYLDASRKAANIISAQVILQPDSVLGLATGSSPIGIYQRLISWYEKGDIDFSQAKAINLDEYVGLSSIHNQSYAYYMRHNFFDHINIDIRNTFIPNGLDRNARRECSRYDKIIHDLGGVDLQLLGLGPNGHIGFNEPNEEFVKGTHCVELSQVTIDANARFFESKDQVPSKAYTMGIMDIVRARRVVMIVSGEKKAQAVLDSFCGPVTPKVPASILQLHGDFILVADEAALSLVGDKL
ncbi:MAG: glucosamine-6-phosphate deaminase [Firmicutes bacterium]|nr:glucosamine-6-phosphate deaminase [Bacillota bacterium]